MALVVLICSGFMLWKSKNAQISYTGSKILPTSDSSFVFYNAFKKNFGEDGSVMVVGVNTGHLYDLNVYNSWQSLASKIGSIKGVSNVLCTGHLFELTKNSIKHKFALNLLPSTGLTSQSQVDSLKKAIYGLPFYDGFLFTEADNASLMAISLDQIVLNSEGRTELIDQVITLCNRFAKINKTSIHYSGLPYLRSAISQKISSEFKLFLFLSILTSGVVLLALFRSIIPVAAALLVVVLGVVWSLGFLVLLGYKITLLTALIPSLVVVVGIPNSTLLLNRFQAEYLRFAGKTDALITSIHRAGATTFIANLTTAIGFGVFFYTKSQILGEFGLLAFLSIMSTWLLSTLCIPVFFSFAPPPSQATTAHLHSKFLDGLLNRAFILVTERSSLILVLTAVVILFGIVGTLKLKVNAFMVDDLPKKDVVYQDLKFFEEHFKGVLPFEISIDTKRKSGAQDYALLAKLDTLEDKIRSNKIFSPSVSINKVLKYSRQAFFGGGQNQYQLPTEQELSFMGGYVSQEASKNSLLRSYLDSNAQVARISFQMQDIGSNKMNSILRKVKSQIDSVLPASKYNVHMTGSSILFLKGTNYLVKNLVESLLLAIFLISLIMFYLFKTPQMVVISLIPNLIPLLLTAGLMGFLQIPLKPSTMLIFSIAFGLASDQTIYFLTRFRLEAKERSDDSFSDILQRTFRGAGISMVYTAVILFTGFSIFTASQFGGTVALGLLVSVTLLSALVSNLFLLPALLYVSQADKRINNRSNRK